MPRSVAYCVSRPGDEPGGIRDEVPRTVTSFSDFFRSKMPSAAFNLLNERTGIGQIERHGRQAQAKARAELRLVLWRAQSLLHSAPSLASRMARSCGAFIS